MTSALTIADRPVNAIAILAIVVLNAVVDELAARPQKSSATSNNRKAP